MYGMATMRVKLNKFEKTNPIDVTQGVLQGNSLSPLIFALLLQDIVDFFKKDGHINVEDSVEMLLFADDLTILSKDVVDL